MTRRLHLNAFLMSTGHHEASWRLPESDPRANTDVAHFVHLARTAERGLMDSVFFADSPALLHEVGRRPAGVIDPTILLAVLSAATERIGLIATASTTYHEPYNLARAFASLDQVSGGRAGWNIVTTATLAAARNFNREELPGHQYRYERAAEFVEVVQKLWDSWDDDAVLADKQQGVWADRDRVHPIDHVGTHFRVAGPLNLPRTPQGRPVLVQAGSSPDGRQFAARWAEAIFTAHQTLADAQEFYADLKDRARRLGRDPRAVKVLPGIVPAIGSTEAEARELEDRLDQLIRPEYAREQLARTLQVRPEDLPLDEQLPADLPEPAQVQGAQSRYQLIVSLGRREGLTVRQLISRLGGGRGHRTFSGTPEQVADTIEEWFTSGAADGFNVMPPVLPSGLETFVDEVIPILQRRGLFRTEYAGTTLREHYGLDRPSRSTDQQKEPA